MSYEDQMSEIDPFVSEEDEETPETGDEGEKGDDDETEEFSDADL